MTDPSKSKQFRGHDYSDASVTNVVKGLANSQPAVYNLSNAEKCISVFRAKYTILITATMSKAEILFGVQKSVLTEKGEKRSIKDLILHLTLIPETSRVKAKGTQTLL